MQLLSLVALLYNDMLAIECCVMRQMAQGMMLQWTTPQYVVSLCTLFTLTVSCSYNLAGNVLLAPGLVYNLVVQTLHS